MHGRERGRGLVPARRVPALAVAEVGRAPWLVERRPGVHSITEGGAHDRGIVLERVGGRARRPAARILERLRQVPVVQRRDRLDAAGEQSVDEPRVEVDAGLVHRPGPGRLDARPRDGEAVRAEAEPGHEVEVALPAVVVIARDVAGVAVPHLAGRLAEGVPDRRPAAVFLRRALDLVGSGRGAEGEAGREDETRIAVVGRSLDAGGGEERHAPAFPVPASGCPCVSKRPTRPSGVVTVTSPTRASPGNTRKRRARRGSRSRVDRCARPTGAPCPGAHRSAGSRTRASRAATRRRRPLRR